MIFNNNNIRFSKWLQLISLMLMYAVGELSHFLLGVVTTPMSQEIHYGDHGCLANPDLDENEGPAEDVYCYKGNSSQNCLDIWQSSTSNTTACRWDYSGLGMAYQLLAGPAFVAVFTFAGVANGFLSDKFNRKTVLVVCLSVLTVATSLMGGVTRYWHLVFLRMMVGASESAFAPSASSIISDMFSQTVRAFALGLFNWGIYLGYGLSYIIGNYGTAADILGMGWRWTYFITGLMGVVALLLLLLLLEEPQRGNKDLAATFDDGGGPEIGAPSDEKKDAGDLQLCEDNKEAERSSTPSTSKLTDTEADTGEASGANKMRRTMTALFASDFWIAINTSSFRMLCLAASVRHTGGFTWAYNTQLYFQTYYPSFPVGAWVSWVSILGGTVGGAVGGLVADKLVARLGLRARLYVLAGSTLLASPLAAGVLLIEPPGAMYSLLGAYFFAEMWFGILFAVLLEVVAPSVKSSALAFFLFVMNNIGGNAPVLVEPLREAFGYRAALLIMYPGCFLLSSLLFLLTSRFVPNKKENRGHHTAACCSVEL